MKKKTFYFIPGERLRLIFIKNDLHFLYFNISEEGQADLMTFLPQLHSHLHIFHFIHTHFTWGSAE